MKYVNYYFNLVYSEKNQPSDECLKSIGEIIKNLPNDKNCPQNLHKFAKSFETFEIQDNEIIAGVSNDIPYENEIEDFSDFLKYLKAKNPEIDFLATVFFHTDDPEDDLSSTTNLWDVYLCEEDKIKAVHSLYVEFDGDVDEYNRRSEIAGDIVNNILIQYKSGDIIDDYLLYIDEWEDDDFDDEDCEEDFGFPFDENRDFDSLTIDNYYVVESFCSIGFYDKTNEKLYSIGRFNMEGSPNSYDFVIHDNISLETFELVLYHLAEYEYIKSERDIDVLEYFEFSSKAALKEKLEETGITICNQLLERLSKFDSEFPQDI